MGYSQKQAKIVLIFSNWSLKSRLPLKFLDSLTIRYLRAKKYFGKGEDKSLIREDFSEGMLQSKFKEIFVVHSIKSTNYFIVNTL